MAFCAGRKNILLLPASPTVNRRERTFQMNLTSFLANRCLAFLLNGGLDKKGQHICLPAPGVIGEPPLQHVLPPWIADAQEFRTKCDGCGKCIDCCAEKILVSDRAGFPQVDFSLGACTFCGACAASCTRGVFFDPVTAATPWQVRAVIATDACLASSNVLCMICAEHCAENAIIIPKMAGTFSAPLVLPDRCSGCGACFRPCPNRAISMRKEEPPNHSQEVRR